MSPLWAVGVLAAAVLAAFGLWAGLRMWHIPRVRASDAEQSTSFAQHCDDALDVIAADKNLRTDIVAAFGHDEAKSRHTDQAMRRLTHDHTTAEEAADCVTCSPSDLPRRIEDGGEHA